MYIVSKNREEMYNLDRATNIYISSDGCSVKICVDGTRGGQLGKYNSSEETQEAMSWWKPTFSDPDSGGYPRYRDTFALDLWNSTIKKTELDKYGWEANPWVWVIEFERVEV